MRPPGRFSAYAAASMAAALLTALSACSGGPAQTTVPESSAPTSTTPSGPGGSFFGRGDTSGTIARIEGSVLTLSTPNGDVIMNITAGTRVEKSVAGTLADLKVGQFVSAAGLADAHGDMTASSVKVTTRTPGSGFSPPTDSPPNGGRPSPPSGMPTFTRPTGITTNGTSGTVSTISGNRVTLSSPQGQQMIGTVSSATAIEVMTDASLTDLSIGQSVTVSGRPNDQGGIDAFAITISR